MTSVPTIPHLVFDTTCLSHFARADRLDVLGDILTGTESLMPDVVREEIRAGSTQYSQLTRVLEAEWLTIVALDTIDRIRHFAAWTRRVGTGSRDVGEASVLAVAEEIGAVALIDERNATRVGRSHGVNVHGTIWLLANACRAGQLTEVATGNLVDALVATGMRLPCTGSDFSRYAKANNLLP